MDAVLLGSGWRAAFYIRIARLLPEVLSVKKIYTRSFERAKELREEGLDATNSLDEALACNHDMVIVSSGPTGFADLMRRLKADGETVFCETTFLSLSDDENREFEDMKGFSAEQYPFTPLYASVLASLDLIGEVRMLTLSGLHNHHAAAIARRILDLADRMPDEVHSVDIPSSIVKTSQRGGMVRTGEKEEYTRRLRILRFGEKTFVNDFSSNQYHSYLFGKKLEVRGERGLITEEGVRFLDRNNLPVFMPFVFHRDDVFGNATLALSHVTLGDRTVFINPFYPENMNDDEIALATMLKTGRAPSLREGILDARLGRLL